MLWARVLKSHVTTENMKWAVVCAFLFFTDKALFMQSPAPQTHITMLDNHNHGNMSPAPQPQTL